MVSTVGTSKGYEIEHVWGDHPERHADEFSHTREFQEYRNDRIWNSERLAQEAAS